MQKRLGRSKTLDKRMRGNEEEKYVRWGNIEYEKCRKNNRLVKKIS